ncbi:AfsR/SARP family transcriptional regulator [Actinomadura sp. WMMB 499]|uniref:AfsR/SARP family transcriptional regulator n=1 Tax=Actinomadura sp. WMMB 499 TaxID=1219491 RepID=UPI0012456A49|nr:AfsR/SARP family transcriptional regulator [Actinomadura sp. WMMB 499]QFG24769.1 AfsR/SARP family transcriptional regulator [Actinomadura sp. WMMB 499]
MVRFKVLGSLEITDHGRVCTLTAPKVRQVLALLLLRTGRLVQNESVVRELWGDAPPKSASTTVQTYIYQLRKALGRERSGSEPLSTQPCGYQMRIDPAELDACLFERYVAEGRRMLDGGRAEDASQRLRQALDLWTGPPLADVTQGPLLSAHAVHLQEQRIRALELRISADVQLDRGRDLIGELRSLVTRYPLHEWFHGQLIEALTRAGRRAEALQAYHNLRIRLDTELGLEPSPELQRLHYEVLVPAERARRSQHQRPVAMANGSSRG